MKLQENWKIFTPNFEIVGITDKGEEVSWPKGRIFRGGSLRDLISILEEMAVRDGVDRTYNIELSFGCVENSEPHSFLSVVVSDYDNYMKNAKTSSIEG